MKLNKSQELILSVIDKHGYYVVCSYEKKMSKVAGKMIRLGLVDIISETTNHKVNVGNGDYKYWSEYRIGRK